MRLTQINKPVTDQQTGPNCSKVDHQCSGQEEIDTNSIVDEDQTIN